ncbi:SufS family cysteine desulfurase [Buchananella hordeovulneris]|uniref:aminotransferase class V-fold PLP-dependent enzyme n=1 Tax=Buchananella hordeovulneris TaxID=52770 RepID=UPI000F5E2430|nr:SufS family cysteine desulfurase [Buchananella hordeovulneris]RRD52330.1 SufS family cysteine desulfurase [Buchananella hordeovulneris]
MTYDPDRLRADFPALQQAPRGGSRLVYLDWAATAQRPQAVMAAEVEFTEQAYGAVNRGTHLLADRATEAFEAARTQVASYLGAEAHNLVWTSGATAALNMVAGGLGLAAAGWRGSKWLRLGPGDEIAVTRAEHHANLVPWQELAARTGARLTWLELDAQGRIDLASLPVINSRTKVVACTHASNVTGALTPVAEIVAAARQVGAVTVLDACQSAAHGQLDLPALGVDFAAVSAHKMCGPTGIGALYGRAEMLAQLPPTLTGGSMVTTVTMEKAEFHAAPAGLEAGTQPVTQAVAWAAAVKYLRALDSAALQRHSAEMTELLLAAVRRVPHVRLLGPDQPDHRLPIVAFAVDGVHPHDVGQFLDSQGVAVRVGHHCAQPLHAHFGVKSSSRASAGPVTTRADIEVFAQALAQVRSFFGVQ